MTIFVFVKLLGCLALLMFGMKAMSDALQKMAGPQLRHVLGTMTTNRFTGMLTGTFVTAAVQSSTATTLLTVSFVNAGLLTLAQAITVIMGAHIGTTVTAWIMSLGFSFNISDFVFPAFFVGIILIYMKRRRIIGDFLFGAAFLFLGLGTLKETGFALVQDPDANAVISAFFSRFNDSSFWNSFFFLFMGTVLTLCVQSSAAIMAITMILCSTGVLHIDQGILLVLGENVGTTITANIVAIGANTQARRAAFAHLSINVIGVTWALILLQPFVNLVCGFVGFDRTMMPSDPGYAMNLTMISVVLATFHSAFNVTNTLLQIGFVHYIERFVCKVINPKVSEEDEESRLKFIAGGLLSTAELSILQAQKEISLFAIRTIRMFNFIPTLLFETKTDEDFSKLFARIEKYEQISDNMEIEIANYLNQVTEGHLSAETKTKIRYMLREVGEIESIGDSCYNMARTINQKHTKNEHFTDEQKVHIRHMFELCNKALEHMQKVLDDDQSLIDINESLNIENEINNFRTQLRESNVNDINNHLYNYQAGVQYMDIIHECEKLGDYVINVVEAHAHKKLTA
ncbi:MAG: Na/Pi cotransporter family protein [Bacteroidales bacterium]|nr:Na/Pi cotransporter family protein [Bacteroidales bacterium]MBQ3845421.1 Na/Pi cotransporter family protein [Bacteroidales bacterium]